MKNTTRGRQFLQAQRELGSRPVFPELEFFDISLQEDALDLAEVPTLEDEVLPLLTSHRLILLGGRRAAEKMVFAKQLAWLLSSKRMPEGGSLQVRRWQHSSGLIDLSGALDRVDEETIFLFPGLQPHHLGGYDLRRLLDDLGRRSHYAIITTESRIEGWSACPGDLESELWIDADRTLVTPEFLAEILLVQLDERLPDELAMEIGVGDLGVDDVLVGELGVREVAEALETTGRIRTFVAALALQSELTETSVRKVLRQLSDERHAVHGWFRGLPTRQQILALALSLFDGLLDDQIFSALETLVERAWRQWDPSCAQFDYHELEAMTAYFRGFERGTETAPIECLSDDCREALFEVAWRVHRRRLLAALPVMGEMVKASPGAAGRIGPRTNRASEGDAEQVEENDAKAAEDDSSEDEEESRPSDLQVGASRWHRLGRWRDLFGSSLRNGLIRDRLAGALSEIGRLSVNAVEPVLLDLAQDQRHSVQLVAADALARWREPRFAPDGDQRLFRVLAAWQSESFQKEMSQYLRRRRKAARPFARIRATIALTVSRASVYDPPNHLEDRFVELFIRLLQDRNRLVRSRVRTDTIPLVLQSHLKQLESEIWEHVIPEADLLVGASLGMARAHLVRPEETGSILRDWLQRARTLPQSHEAKGSHRTHALALLALTFGLLEPGSGDGDFMVEEIFDVLGNLLATEDDGLVRSAVLNAMIRQATYDLDRVAPHIQSTVEELAMEERSLVVEEMTRLYLEQRRGLARGVSSESPPDVWRMVEGQLYPLWVETERPRTAMEEMLGDWLEDPWRPVALQLAVECFSSFQETELETIERQLRTEAEEPLEESPPEDESDDPASLTRRPLRRLSAGGQVASFLVSPLDGRNRKAVAAALPEILRRRDEEERGLRAFLRRLRESDEPRREVLFRRETLQLLLTPPSSAEGLLVERLAEVDPSLAGRLRWAVGLHAWRWALGLFCLCGLALLTLVLYAL